jgi:hypothetical protein
VAQWDYWRACFNLVRVSFCGFGTSLSSLTETTRCVLSCPIGHRSDTFSKSNQMAQKSSYLPVTDPLKKPAKGHGRDFQGARPCGPMTASLGPVGVPMILSRAIDCTWHAGGGL